MSHSERSSGTSTLLEQATGILKRLAEGGWDKVFAAHGLDITPADLRQELLRELPQVDRSAPGFEDFSLRGRRAIEPGRPEESLLYHGLASPNFVAYLDAKGVQPVEVFASPAEIEVIENLVFGIRPPTMQDLRVAANGAPLAMVVYAKEYRPAVNTVHRRHADSCFSRTGISRVGTAAAEFIPSARGYLPLDESNPNSVRVLPCRYAAFIAALAPGDRDTHGPMRFLEPRPAEPADEGGGDKVAGVSAGGGSRADGEVGDAVRRFWIPIHKLFSGTECIAGFDLEVTLSAFHMNEKLRRAHLRFGALGHDGGWHEPDISKPPFVFTEGIAELSGEPDDGEGLLVPDVKAALAEIATYKGKSLTYNVPRTKDDAYPGLFVFESTLGIRSHATGARSAPEYLHARYAVDYEGNPEQDLNELENVRELVRDGGYRAKHVLDFTGDGYVDVTCPQLALEVPHRLAAFSIVATPDFFPGVKQRDLMQWWDQSAPASLKSTIWPSNPGEPEALSDQRMAGNLELPEEIFNPRDDTVTAIVGGWGRSAGAAAQVIPLRSRRSSMLPDGAAGVFAPGWDVSWDEKLVEIEEEDDSRVVGFFATYGLGSPFAEDTKLCAALSSYWPAVAPDITRTFQPSGRYATATPLLDETIGQGGADAWDGIPGPKKIDSAKRRIEYSDIRYGDYVTTSLENGFDVGRLGAMDPMEYWARTVATARMYQSLGALKTEDKVEIRILSFTRADAESDAGLKAALAATGAALDPAYAYRYEVFGSQGVVESDDVPLGKVWVEYDEIKTLYADAVTVLSKDDKGKWNAKRPRD